MVILKIVFTSFMFAERKKKIYNKFSDELYYKLFGTFYTQTSLHVCNAVLLHALKTFFRINKGPKPLIYSIECYTILFSGLVPLYIPKKVVHALEAPRY